MSKIAIVLSKIADFLIKKSRNGEKEQDLELKKIDVEVKKIDIYKKLVFVVTIVALLMCIISSLKPELAITGYWFDLLEKMIEATQ